MSDLRSALYGFRGEVVLPGDSAFDEASLAWNRGVIQHPAGVLTPIDEADVITALQAARAAGLTVTAQSTGHGASGPLEGVLMLKMHAFDRVEVDPATRVARVGAGVQIGGLLAALDGTGLVAPTGTSRVVGVAGFLLGGGHGWFTRSAGLGSHNLIRVRAVFGDGTARWVGDDEPALMAAFRGAGGVLAIITELVVKLTPVASLRGGSIDFALDDFSAVARAVQHLSESAPPGLAVTVSAMRMPDAPQLPPHLRGKQWVSVEVVLSDVPDSTLDPVRAAAPVTSDSTRDLPPSELHQISGDPENPSAALGWCALLTQLDDALIDRLDGFLRDPGTAAVIGVSLRMLGGVAPSTPSYATTGEAGWLLYSVAPVPLPAAEPAATRALARLQAAAGDAALKRVPPTFVARDETLARAFEPDQLAALHALRSQVGAEGVIEPTRLPSL